MDDRPQDFAASLQHYEQFMHVGAWGREERHKVMYRDERKID